MLIPRGFKTDRHGAAVNKVIARINDEYPTEKPLPLWYVTQERIAMRDDRRYGKNLFLQPIVDYAFITNTGTLYVAAKRKVHEIAGTIAFQYGLWLQVDLNREIDHTEAVAFAKYMTGQADERPAELIAAYEDKYNKKGMESK